MRPDPISRPRAIALLAAVGPTPTRALSQSFALPLALVLVLGMALVAPRGAQAAGDGPAQRGRELFEGRAPLQGHIVGHDSALPAGASRCINCHGVGTAPPDQRGSDATRAFGPLLNRATLAESLPRRGGPPSRYDAAALCRLLRDGVDPAYVLIPRAMPRYTLTDADCGALWTYLTSEP